MANPTVKATIPQAANVKAALWVSPDVEGGSGAWDAKNSVRYAPWGTLSSAALGSTGINGLSSPGSTNCGIDLGLAQLHSSTPFDVTGSGLTIIVCAAADATGSGRFIQNQNGYSPSQGWVIGSDSTYMAGGIAPLTCATSSGGSVPTSEIAVYAMTYDGTAHKLYRNGTQVGTVASTGNLSYNTTGERRAALFNYYQSHAINAIAQRIFGALVYDKALTPAELQTFGTSNAAIVAGSFHAAAFDFAGGTVTHATSGSLVSSVASVSGSATRTGAVTTHSASGTLAAQAAVIVGASTRSVAGSRTITIPAIKDLTTGALRNSQTGITVIISDLTTGNLVVKKTSQTTDSSGNCTISDAALVAATTYRVTTILVDGSEGTWKYTAA